MADLRIVKVSAANARLMFITCGPDCIAAGCGGNCCDAPTRASGCLVTIHPSEQGRIAARGGVVVDGLLRPEPGARGCPFKHDGLCGLHFTPDKPFGCIASPFTLNSNSTLIVRNRYKLLPCYRNEGAKQPAYRAFQSSLEIIFGVNQAADIAAHFDSGGDDYFARMAGDVFAKLTENDAIKKRAA